MAQRNLTDEEIQDLLTELDAMGEEEGSTEPSYLWSSDDSSSVVSATEGSDVAAKLSDEEFEAQMAGLKQSWREREAAAARKEEEQMREMRAALLRIPMPQKARVELAADMLVELEEERMAKASKERREKSRGEREERQRKTSKYTWPEIQDAPLPTASKDKISQSALKATDCKDMTYGEMLERMEQLHKAILKRPNKKAESRFQTLVQHMGVLTKRRRQVYDAIVANPLLLAEPSAGEFNARLNALCEQLQQHAKTLRSIERSVQTWGQYFGLSK